MAIAGSSKPQQSEARIGMEKESKKSHRSSSKERKRERAAVSEDDDEGEGQGSSKGGRERLRKTSWAKKKFSGPKESAFRYLYPIIDIPIPPALMHDPHRAADELMDTLLMRYVPQLSGVLISHRNISFLRSHASIDSDGAYSIAPAGLTCLAWSPEIGMRLEGTIQLSTPSHVSLLVHGIFNVSITSAHLPSTTDAAGSGKDAKYRWQENEDGYGDVKMEEEGEEGADAMTDDMAEKSTGSWIHCETGERLGGPDGKVTFTVVGMTITNHMLSLFGSLLRKPFSIAAPTFVPTLAKTMTKTDTVKRVHFREETQSHVFPANAENEEDEGDSDEDSLPETNVIREHEVVAAESSSSKKKKRSKIGPKREGEISGSESESEPRDKKRRKKEL